MCDRELDTFPIIVVFKFRKREKVERNAKGCIIAEKTCLF